MTMAYLGSDRFNGKEKKNVHTSLNVIKKNYKLIIIVDCPSNYQINTKRN